MASVIASLAGRTINDSRGQLAVEVTVTDEVGRVATASLPSGSSVSQYEPAVVDPATAVTTINTIIAPSLIRTSLEDQRAFDTKLQELDDSTDQTMGVNSLLGISFAVARLIAQMQNKPLYECIRQLGNFPGYSLPTPMFNLINGNKHADNNLDFQEYFVIPVSMPSFHEKFQAGKRIFAELGRILQESGHEITMGFEGGFAPNLETNEEGFRYLLKAIEAAGYIAGSDVFLGSDIAASSLPSTYSPSVANYISLFDNFPLLSIEDPFTEDDWDNWSQLKTELDKRSTQEIPRLLVGDDLFAGNKERILQGVQQAAANAVLIKINQASTLSAIIDSITTARENNLLHILSHRSGETLDPFVSDIAIGTGAAFIKAGSPNDRAPERIIKYERLMQVEEELTMVQSSQKQ